MTGQLDISGIIAAGVRVPERRSLSEEAADALRELILLEKLAPGTPVPERDLAEGLGVSRTPLKEALRILEAEGLIEYGPTRRLRVADPTFEDIAQNIEVLSALEALAGRLACSEATDAEIDRIGQLNARMHGMPLDGPPLDFFHLDMAFHAGVVAAAHNAPLSQTHTTYNARLWRARFMSSRQTDRRANTLAEHDAILDALRGRDPAITAESLGRHLESTVANLAHVLNETEA